MFLTVALVEMREMPKKYYVSRILGPVEVEEIPSCLIKKAFATRCGAVGTDMIGTMLRLEAELRLEAKLLGIGPFHTLDPD